MMKYYSVRQFCAMVGVPYSSLRYYERIGLLKPKQDEVNNYRLYTVNDAFLLNRFKNYRSIGFDVKEALEMINNNCHEEFFQKIEKLEEDIESKIRLLQEQKQRINQIKKELSYLHDETGYQIVECEDRLFLPASEGLDFTVANFEQFSKWVELLPVTAYSKRIKQQSKLQKDYGISIKVSDVHLLGEELTANAEWIKGGKCLMFISDKLKKDNCLLEGLKPAFDYIEREQLIQNGDIYLEGVMHPNEDGSKSDYVFIPIL